MIDRALYRVAEVLGVYIFEGRAAAGRHILVVVHEACARSHCPAAHKVADALEELLSKGGA